MNPDLPTELTELVAELLGMNATEVLPSAALATYEGWDSLQLLNLSLMIEERYGIEIQPDDLAGLVTIDAIVELLGPRLH